MAFRRGKRAAIIGRATFEHAATLGRQDLGEVAGKRLHAEYDSPPRGLRRYNARRSTSAGNRCRKRRPCNTAPIPGYASLARSTAAAAAATSAGATSRRGETTP